MLEGRPIEPFNGGHMQRDFTYIDGIVEGVLRVLDRPAAPDAAFDKSLRDPARSWAPFRVFNIDGQGPVQLSEPVSAIEVALGRVAKKNQRPMWPGDVPATYADFTDLTRWTGFKPGTPIAEGVARFVEWHRGSCKV